MTTAAKNPVFTLGDRMAKSRQAAGLTQGQMGELMGVSHSSIAKWENDEMQPRRFLSRIRLWAEITGVDVAWLIGEEFKSRGHSTRSNRTGPGRKTRRGRAPAPAPLAA